jgi:hypothetical protein
VFPLPLFEQQQKRRQPLKRRNGTLGKQVRNAKSVRISTIIPPSARKFFT